MNSIRVTRKQYWKAVSKNLLKTLPIVILLAILLLELVHWKDNRITISATVLILLSLGDMLTRFHVDELVLNNDKQVVEIHLSSIMSGEKNMQFPLNGLTVSMKHLTGWKRFFSGSLLLQIQDSDRNQFRITSRNGFSPADLEQFYAWLQASGTPIITV